MLKFEIQVGIGAQTPFLHIAVGDIQIHEHHSKLVKNALAFRRMPCLVR